MSNEQKNGSPGADSGQKVQSKAKPVPRIRSAKPKQIEEDEFMAAAIGDIDWLKQSIKGNKHDVKFDKNGLDAVHIAAIHGRLECLKMLIGQMKVDVNVRSKNGWRPIHLCISNQTGSRSLTCLKYLLEQGADHSVSNDDGVTPCHQAASEGHIQCLKALIEAGARVDKVDNRGHRPIDLAKLWGFRKCARILAMQKWNKEKDFLECEMEKMRKQKVKESLEDTTSEEDMQAQKFYGDVAYTNWLSGNHLKDNQGRRTKESLQKANSLKAKPSGKSDEDIRDTSRAHSATRPEEAGITRESDESSNRGQHEMKPADLPKKKEAEKIQRVTAPIYGQWNSSNKIPSNRALYIPLLPDYYPRDEYTSFPKFPARRISDKEHAKRHAKRPVVYKTKHIADTQKKKLYDCDDIPRMESGIHLTDDTESHLFKAGLLPLTAQQLYGSEVRSTPSSDYTDSLKKYNLPQMMESLRRTAKPDHFPKLAAEKREINV